MVRYALLPLSLLVATGCSAVVSGSSEEALDAQSTSVTGVVVVDRVLTDESARGGASARFVRLRGPIDDGSLRLVGAALDLPAIGECRVTAAPEAAVSRSVELLDVGGISIESPASGQHIAMVGRQVPDVVDLVSGTMYSARIDESAVPASSDVAVVVSGSADVPAFSVRATTPETPSDVHVGIHAAQTEIAWTVGAVGAQSDFIYVDVVPAHGDVARCSFADDGRGVIAVAMGDEGLVTVHRVRREQLSIPGIGGELRFDFARAVSYHR